MKKTFEIYEVRFEFEKLSDFVRLFDALKQSCLVANYGIYKCRHFTF